MAATLGLGAFSLLKSFEKKEQDKAKEDFLYQLRNNEAYQNALYEFVKLLDRSAWFLYPFSHFSMEPTQAPVPIRYYGIDKSLLDASVARQCGADVLRYCVNSEDLEWMEDVIDDGYETRYD